MSLHLSGGEGSAIESTWPNFKNLSHTSPEFPKIALRAPVVTVREGITYVHVFNSHLLTFGGVA